MAIRIGNREREAARHALDEHLAEGRLDMDEYADRYAKANLARFQSELDELFVDLPQPHATPAPTVSLEKLAQDRRVPALRMLRVAAIVLAVAIAVPILSAWWVLWFVVPMVCCGRRRWMWGRAPYGWASQQWRRGWASPGRF